MAIPTAATMTQTDSLTGEEVEEIEFSIGDPRWVMKTQADLYSNRELAVTREYSTNAFDANKQYALDHGMKVAPIHVSLPTALNPYFKVRDYGYGMTRDILASVYTKFGTSTKRDSDHYNGMLGYGSKSAVAYSSQFTVVSIAKGIKTVAVVTRKADWSIVMKVVSKAKTDEPSGTEITVPVHNPDEFRQKAMDFYKFWLPGTVLVDGKEPKHEVGEKITDGFYYSNSWHQSYVVMGNVPYRITNSDALFRDTRMNPFQFIAYVDNGDVEFTPSREDLKYTDLTKNTLHGIVKKFAADLVAKAKDDIDSAKNHAEAYQAWRKWTNELGGSLFADLTFKGDKFTSRFPVNGYYYRYASRNGSYNVNDWNVESADKTLFIMEAAMPTAGNLRPAPTTLMKYNAQQYKEINNLTGYSILFVRAGDIDCKWINTKGDNFIKYEDLAKQIPKKQKATGAAPGSWKTIRGSWEMIQRSRISAEWEIPSKLPTHLYYIDTRTMKNYNVHAIIDCLPDDLRDKVKVINVPGNRKPKFHRDNPEITEFIPFAVSQIVKDGASLLSKDAIEAKSIEYGDLNRLKKLDAKKVDDPEIVRYIGLVKANHAEAAYERNLSLANHLKKYDLVKAVEIKKTAKPFKDYSLFTRHVSTYNGLDNEWYVYLNAKYAQNNPTKKGK